MLERFKIIRSMSRAGTPTDNMLIEAVNDWIKAELFTDLYVTGARPIEEEGADYVYFFNEERRLMYLVASHQNSIRSWYMNEYS